MKTIIGITAILAILWAGPSTSASPPDKTTNGACKNGVAIIMTGAAARIPQEAALLEELDRRGLLKNLVFVSGVSSGALNAVLLNGIAAKKISWTDYRNILFNLRNEDIYHREGSKFPLNTTPARNLYRRVTEEKLGFYRIGDLPVFTEISITHLKTLDLKKNVYRMCSRKINAETDTTLSLVDIMMASSAFPLVFPAVRIRNAKTIPDYEYVDGGVGEDHVPYRALLDFERHRGCEVEKIFIISRKSDKIPDFSEELKVLGINDRGFFDKVGFSFDAILNKAIIKRIREFAAESPNKVADTFVWIPDFENNYMLFDFNNLKEQYLQTARWATDHDPVPLAKFLKEHP